MARARPNERLRHFAAHGLQEPDPPEASALKPFRARHTNRLHHKLDGTEDEMLTALEDIRNKARKAHAEQQYLIAEQHYRTLLRKEANLDDAINLGALLRSQGRLQEASDLHKMDKLFVEERLLLNDAIAGMTTTKPLELFNI